MRAFMTIKFDREVIEDSHYISPGSFEVIAAGKSYSFDFFESSGTIDKQNPKLVHFELRDEDTSTFPEIEELRKHLHEITAFPECYVYTGEPGEDPELIPVAVKKFCIVDYDPNRTVFPKNTEYITCSTIGSRKCPVEIYYSFSKKLLASCKSFPQE